LFFDLDNQKKEFAGGMGQTLYSWNSRTFQQTGRVFMVERLLVP